MRDCASGRVNTYIRTAEKFTHSFIHSFNHFSMARPLGSINTFTRSNRAMIEQFLIRNQQYADAALRRLLEKDEYKGLQIMVAMYKINAPAGSCSALTETAELEAERDVARAERVTYSIPESIRLTKYSEIDTGDEMTDATLEASREADVEAYNRAVNKDNPGFEPNHLGSAEMIVEEKTNLVSDIIDGIIELHRADPANPDIDKATRNYRTPDTLYRRMLHPLFQNPALPWPNPNWVAFAAMKNKLAPRAAEHNNVPPPSRLVALPVSALMDMAAP
jgi:hypothetical protein